MRFPALLLVAGLGLFASDTFALDQSSVFEELDRTHSLVAPEQHVHSRGQIESVDLEQGTISIWHWELGSPDRSIWMPGMGMVFHTTNRAMLKGLRTGDQVAFEAVRLRNAVMVTKIRKLP